MSNMKGLAPSDKPSANYRAFCLTLFKKSSNSLSRFCGLLLQFRFSLCFLSSCSCHWKGFDKPSMTCIQHPTSKLKSGAFRRYIFQKLVEKKTRAKRRVNLGIFQNRICQLYKTWLQMNLNVTPHLLGNCHWLLRFSWNNFIRSKCLKLKMDPCYVEL